LVCFDLIHLGKLVFAGWNAVERCHDAPGEHYDAEDDAHAQHSNQERGGKIVAHNSRLLYG
jgi:hypothetical protein